MNVRLTPQQQEFLKRQVSAGRYVSEAEAVREGLRLLEEEISWREEMRRKIEEGVAEADAGDLVDGEDAINDLIASIPDDA